MFGASKAYRIALRIFFIDPVPVSLWECSGGSRGGSQGAMDPPFQTEPCMQNRTQSNLPEVRQSLPASTLGLSVQSSNKQSLKHLNLQAWCSNSTDSYNMAHTSAACPHKKWAWLKFFAPLVRIFSHMDPPFWIF